MSDLPQYFAKTLTGINILAFKTEKLSCTYKKFTEARNFRHFNQQKNIHIKINISGYAINRVFTQMTLDEHFSNWVTNDD